MRPKSHGNGFLTDLAAQTFADRLRSLRIARNMNQADLAMCSGLSPATICRFEKGVREPTLCSAAVLARALKVSIDDLVTEEMLCPAT